MWIIQSWQSEGPATLKNPVQDYTIFKIWKVVAKDCITSSKQLLYVTRDVTCNHVIYRQLDQRYTKIIYGEIFERNSINFKHCKLQEIVSFPVRL